MLGVIDELLTDIYVRSHHFILLIIEPIFGRVDIMDSLKRPHEDFQSLIDMLQR